MRRFLIVSVVVVSAVAFILAFARNGDTQNRGDRGRRGGRPVTPVSSVALPRAVSTPPGNAASTDTIALGRMLFWDPILSGHKDVACATCHHPSFGYAENRDVSIGVHGVGLG